MGLEDLTGADKFIDDLVNTNPVSGDAPSQGDDHIRGVKNVLGNCFPAITGAVTSTHTELNILDGVTSTTAELNILDGVTSTAAELNILDGVTATAAELNYNDITAAGTAEASKALILDGSKDISGINNLGVASETLTSTDTGATAGPTLTLDRNSASPADNDFIGRVLFTGRDHVGGTSSYASINARIVDATNTIEDGRLLFVTSIDGAMETRGYFENGLVVGAPTGLDNGAGTINAEAVYDDNVLLTCYVFDAAIDGDVNETKWDAKAPKDTKHDPMRKFKSRLGGTEDPLDIDKYAQHWMTKRHLTSMPNESSFNHGDMATGEWIQRLIETVEIQAVHIESLNQRIKALEQ